MRTIIKILTITSIIALGMVSGSTAALHIDNNYSHLLAKTVSEIEYNIPTFLVTISTSGSGVVHVKADLSVSIDHELVKDQEYLDRFSAVALKATSETFNGLKPEILNSSELAASQIANNINKIMGKHAVRSLKVKNLAVVRYQ